MDLKEAKEITHGLSCPSKPACPAYNLPTHACRTGSSLVEDPRSVCYYCYARRGRYAFINVRRCLTRRLNAVIDNRKWAHAMTVLIEATGHKYFRWHDSGDILDMQHLEQIVQIAKDLPEVRFNLPTKESGTLQQWAEDFEPYPRNLCVRESGVYVDVLPDTIIPGTTLAGIFTKRSDIGFHCPVEWDKETKTCAGCRACWSIGVPIVIFKLKGKYVGDKIEYESERHGPYFNTGSKPDEHDQKGAF
ncbi:hypothetical protein LCGC14_1927220 [marine sediment metagenome]|uniref:Gene product 88 domain-containing protein n=1 Tax=marine sediment metagenome TaxID=412755 RepID=A0A0F9ILT2_9ZZZZ